MVDITRAINIPGAHPAGPVYYKWLAEQASTRKNILEVGTWTGGSARAMADNTDGLVYAVDPLCGTPEMARYFLGDYPEWLYDEFQKNMEGLTNIRLIRKFSLDAAEICRENNLKFDMIFLDGDHSYEAVKMDILAWHPLLTENGLFCGHDWGYTSVIAAVEETIGGHHLTGVDTVWVAD